MLRRVLDRLRREGLEFRVVRASTHPYLGDAGAAPLTAKQRSVLARGWALGYFAVPRRITLTRLARLTGQSPPALGKMLRRAEGHLVARFLAAMTGDDTDALAGPAAPGHRAGRGPGER
jgi:predicted DNA binding protein